MTLLVVTDIFGAPSPEICLTAELGKTRPVRHLHLADLCNRPDLSGEALHKHLFLGKGLAQVTAALFPLSNKDTLAIGYSAGGTALWQAVQQGMQLARLICVSSTRLRDEGSIDTPHHVIFGQDDPGRPGQDWLDHVPQSYDLIPDVGHAFYTDPQSHAYARGKRAFDRALA